MKWIAISGSWRKTSQEVEHDVRACVARIITQGDGIVTGGALNVDFFAVDEALKYDPKAEKIRIFLPVTLERYAAHYRQRAKEGIITDQQAEELIGQLLRLKSLNPDSVIENPSNVAVNQVTYFERITRIIEHADELYAFQVNDSPGVQDTIDKARKKGIPVHLKSYSIA